MTTFLIYLIGVVVAFVIGSFVLKYYIAKIVDEEEIENWICALFAISIFSWIGIALIIGVAFIVTLVNRLSCILYNWINNK